MRCIETWEYESIILKSSERISLIEINNTFLHKRKLKKQEFGPIEELTPNNLQLYSNWYIFELVVLYLLIIK